MLIFAGQGNPGAKYAKNRHNAGFMLVDALHDALKFGSWREKFESEIAEGEIDGVRVVLIKPQTFYNETGRALAKAAKFYKLDVGDVTVFHDEIDLAPGRLRVKRGGGHSGNNGIRSAIEHIGADIRRVRIGIGHPGDKDQVMPYVLSNFSKDDLVWFGPLKEAMLKSINYLSAGDDERFQTEVMRLAPAPKADPKQS